MRAHGTPDAIRPDPGRATSPEDLGRELTAARERAELTIREAARAAGIPASTAGDYFAGRHLPSASQPQILIKLLSACGISGPDAEPWVRALSRVRRSPGRRASGTIVPYRGLAAFGTADSEWFFGRDDLADLLARLAADGPAGTPIVVTGPSGSGKSSLLQAGLIPRLSASAPPGKPPPATVLLTPGADPVGALGDLAGALADRAGAAGQAAERAVIVVDQFEEVFTACEREDQRQQFITALCELSRTALVVLGLRADFYAHALRYPGLTDSLQRRQVVVGPMTEDELRQTILGPARKAGITLEPGLAELLISELTPRAGGAPAGLASPGSGSLPLLSHALRMTWERSRNGRLTVADYRAVGGIRNAVAQTAEAAYTALEEPDKVVARRLFLHLVLVSDDAPIARGRVPLAELTGAAGTGAAGTGAAGTGAAGTGAAGRVLERFVAERLVTVDAEHAEIAHEALLGAWPRLHAWVSAEQEDLTIRHRVRAAATAWQLSGRDDAALLRGGPLAIAADWADRAAGRDELSPQVSDFVGASRAHEKARQATRRRQVRRLRQLSAALAALAILSGGLAAYAFQQRQSAAAARNQADSREVALEAEQLLGQDPALAAQLSDTAYRISPTRLALASLLESAAYPVAARFSDTSSLVQAVALTPSRRVLAVAAADGTLRLWNVARPGRPVPLGPSLTRPGPTLYAAAISPSGGILAAAGAAGTIALWDIADPSHPVPLGRPLTGPRSTVYSVAFSPGGHLLAAASNDHTVRLWDIADPRHPVAVGGPLAGPAAVEAVAFSPAGNILAAASADAKIWLWNLASPSRPVPLGGPLAGPTDVVDSLTFNPSGSVLAAGSRDGSVWRWNISRPGHPAAIGAPLSNATDWVNAVAFSPDGHIIAAASSDDQVLLWNAVTGQLLGTLPGPQPVTSLAWDGNHTLIAGGADGMVRLWRVPGPILLAGGGVNDISFSPAGGLLAVAGPDLQLWNSRTRTMTAAAASPGTFANAVAWAPGGRLLAAGYGAGYLRLYQVSGRGLTPVGAPLTATSHGLVEYVAFSPSGRLLASAADDGTVRLWSLADPAHPHQVAILHDAGDNYVFSVAFSPNGQVLAAASSDNLVRLWDVRDPARPRLIGGPLTGPASYAISVSFSPDGRVLAVGSADKTVRLWDVRDPARPRLIGRPLTGPEGYVYSVAFSPGGGTLAAGSTDGTIWLWKVSDPARPVLITHVTDALTPTGHVYSVAFSPGGGTLAAGSSGGSVRLWDIRPAAAIETLCAVAGQPISVAEWRSFIPGRPYQPPCRR